MHCYRATPDVKRATEPCTGAGRVVVNKGAAVKLNCTSVAASKSTLATAAALVRIYGRATTTESTITGRR
jgi:hypothetical protein